MAKPVHRREARKFLIGLGIVGLLGVIGLIGAIVQGGGELPGKSYTYVKAAFDDVGTLNHLQDVTQNGIRVGAVSDIVFRDGKAVVTMRLDGEREIYRDASADVGTQRVRVGNESALGRRFIQFDPGEKKSGPLNGRTISASQTGSPGAVNDLFEAFDAKTRAALSSSLKELGGGLGGHSQDLHDVVHAAPDLLTDIGTISSALTGPDADVPTLLRDANSLVGRFEQRGEQLRALLRQADTTLQAINVDGAQPLDGTIRRLPGTLRQARAGLTAVNQPLADTRSAMRRLQPGGQALGRSADDLRAVFREGVRPLRKLPGVSRQATPAVEKLRHVFADARPLAPQLGRTVRFADVVLHHVAPYAKDIGMFVASHDLLSGRLEPNKHYFSAMLASPGLYNVSAPDPLAPNTEYYPAPGGGAWADTPESERPVSRGVR